MNIAWWIQRWTDPHPNETAIIYKKDRISYLDLHRRANRTSCWLQSLDIEIGDRVVAVLSNCP
jgi:acyl-coenzyme A synthetase/AMP-(fatty) acid ligase